LKEPPAVMDGRELAKSSKQPVTVVHHDCHPIINLGSAGSDGLSSFLQTLPKTEAAMWKGQNEMKSIS
jgi:hypothetical protein